MKYKGVRYTMRKLLLLMTVIIGVFLIAACASNEGVSSEQNSPNNSSTDNEITENEISNNTSSNNESNNSSSDDGEYSIGALWSTTTIPSVQVIIEGIDAEASKTGVEISSMDAQFDPQTQATQASNLVTQQADAVFLNVIDTEGIIPSLQAFQDADIPVIVGTLPLTEEGEDYMTSYIGPDHIENGNFMGELMVEALGEKGGKVAIIEGAPGVVIEQRTGGFTEALGDNIEVVEIQSSHWDRATALSVTQDILSKHPDIAGIFAHNDDTGMGALQAIKQIGKEGEIALIGTDGNKEAVAAIEAGEMYGSVATDLIYNAELQVQAAVDAIEGRDVEKHIYIPGIKLTKESLDEYTPTF